MLPPVMVDKKGVSNGVHNLYHFVSTFINWLLSIKFPNCPLWLY